MTSTIDITPLTRDRTDCSFGEGMPAEIGLAPVPTATTRGPTTETAYLDCPRAYPFLKWAGGKRALVPDIARQLPEGGFGDYWEPFLGGGAVFFGLDNRRTQRSHLSDVNVDLVLCWRMIQTRPFDVIALLADHAERHCKQHYMTTRATEDIQDPVELAARFIYLNKTCFNGLYRVNKKGEFNVPMGSYKNPAICDADNLLAASEVLSDAMLTLAGFEHAEPACGDLIYCDPPYDGTFTGYTGDGFDDSDQERLRDAANRWADDGAYVIVSNSDTSLIRRLWSDWRVVEVNAPRNISCATSSRGQVGELLMLSS